MANQPITEASLKLFQEKSRRIFGELRKDVIGQNEIVEFTVLAIIAGGIFMLKKFEYDELYIAGGLITLVGTIFLAVCLIVTICLGVNISELKTIDSRIAMYQEENTIIEEKIANVIEQYRQHESDIVEEITPHSSIELVTLYPELKSDTLVQKQIEVYVENSNKIRELREDKIQGSVYRWWLYFGG